jgi:nitrate/nitrite transporter NarK
VQAQAIKGDDKEEGMTLRAQDDPEDPGSQVPGQSQVDAAPIVTTGQAAKHPQWELIKNRRILGALFGIVIESGAMLAFDTIIPLFVKDTFDWNSTAAGLVFVCVMIPGFVAPVVGIISDRYGAKLPAVLGFAASVPLLVCLRFITENTLHDKVAFCAILALLGLTFTFSNPALMAEISYAIEAKEATHPGHWGEKGVYGTAYGLYTTAFALGGTIGTLMAGYIQAGPGWGTTTWVLGLFVSVGVVSTSLFVGGKPSKPNGGVSPSNPSEAQTAVGNDVA